MAISSLSLKLSTGFWSRAILREMRYGNDYGFFVWLSVHSYIVRKRMYLWYNGSFWHVRGHSFRARAMKFGTKISKMPALAWLPSKVEVHIGLLRHVLNVAWCKIIIGHYCVVLVHHWVHFHLTVAGIFLNLLKCWRR